MLDYDGTLAPFHENRMEARPPRELLASLCDIASSPADQLAIVSGRPVSELQVLLPDLPARLVGEHGWEEFETGAVIRRYDLSEALAGVLALAAADAAERGAGSRLERKRCSIVLNPRGLERSEAETILSRIAESWKSSFVVQGLVLDRTHGGLELRATAHNKGIAVAGLMDEAPEGTLPVYIGDDLTDEDAFERVVPRGFAIRVGSAAPRSLAPYHMDSAREVAEFLQRWATLLPPVRRAVRE
jgi:trehalose-phosphatase